MTTTDPIASGREGVEAWLRSHAVEEDMSLNEVSDRTGLPLLRLYELMYGDDRPSTSERRKLETLFGDLPDVI